MQSTSPTSRCRAEGIGLDTSYDTADSADSMHAHRHTRAGQRHHSLRIHTVETHRTQRSGSRHMLAGEDLHAS